MSNDTTTVKPGGSAEFKLTPKTDLDNSVEVFNAQDLQTKAGALETAFSEFAQILGEVNTFVNSEVNTSHDKCVFGPGYGTQLLKLWNDNASTFGDFQANFESWSQAIAIIANKNSQTEVDNRAIYGDRGDTITAFDENGITNESIAAMRERINLEDTALNDFGGNSYTYYDENGNLISVQKDANGNIVGQIIRDANGNIISETYTDSDGNYAVITYDGDGNPVVTYYDKDGNVLTTKPDSFNADGSLTEAEKKELGVPQNPTQEEIDELGYDPSKWDENGINRETGTPYDADGYDVNGYDANGYDRDGFNADGVHKDTGTEFGPDGYNQDGYDKDGYNRQGFDKDGYDKDGYNYEGWDKDGVHKETGTEYGPDGYNKDGYDENGFDRDGYDKNGLDADGNPRPETGDNVGEGTEGGVEEGTEGGSEGGTEGGSEGGTEGELTAETAGYSGHGSDKGRVPENATVSDVDSFAGDEGVKSVTWKKENGDYVTVMFDKDGNEISAIVSSKPFDPNNPDYDSVKEWSDGNGNEYDRSEYQGVLTDDPEYVTGGNSGDMDQDGVPDSEDIYYDDDIVETNPDYKIGETQYGTTTADYKTFDPNNYEGKGTRFVLPGGDFDGGLSTANPWAQVDGDAKNMIITSVNDVGANLRSEAGQMQTYLDSHRSELSVSEILSLEGQIKARNDLATQMAADVQYGAWIDDGVIGNWGTFSCADNAAAYQEVLATIDGYEATMAGFVSIGDIVGE